METRVESDDTASTSKSTSTTVKIDCSGDDDGCSTFTTSTSSIVVNIVVVGCGWWSQGWHIPHLYRNSKNVNIIAFVDTSIQPKSSLNPNLVSVQQLSDMYSSKTKTPIKVYTTVQELLNDSIVSNQIDGVIIATPHSSHASVCQLFINEGIRRVQLQQQQRDQQDQQDQNQKTTPITILLEKPMTTDVEQAYQLHTLVQQYETIVFGSTSNALQQQRSLVLLNHSANYRQQAVQAKAIVSNSNNGNHYNNDNQQQQYNIGTVRYIIASFISPLLWIFDDNTNVGWNTCDPQTPSMLGNGFAWGQSSHLLAWIYYVCPFLVPKTIHCIMNHSTSTGADISHSATITCTNTNTTNTTTTTDTNDVIINLSGTSLVPCDLSEPIQKDIRIEIYGTNGMISYSGNDCDPKSGKLQVRTNETTGHVQVVNDQFVFEELSPTGTGPQSLQSFIMACIDNSTYSSLNNQTSTTIIGTVDTTQFVRSATTEVGYKTIQTISGMYSSHHTKQLVQAYNG